MPEPPLPAVVEELVQELTEWVEDAVALNVPVLLLLPADDLAASVGAHSLLMRTSMLADVTQSRRQPGAREDWLSVIVDGTAPLDAELALGMCLDVIKVMGQLPLPPAPNRNSTRASSHARVSEVVRLSWDVAQLCMSLAGYDATSTVMSGGSVVAGLVGVAHQLRETQSPFEVPLLNDAFLRQQLAATLCLLARTVPTTIVFSRSAAKWAWLDDLIHEAELTSSPLTIIILGDKQDIERLNVKRVGVTTQTIVPSTLDLRELQQCQRWLEKEHIDSPLGLSTRRDALGSLAPAIESLSPADLSLIGAIRAYCDASGGTRLITLREIQFLFDSELPVEPFVRSLVDHGWLVRLDERVLEVPLTGDPPSAVDTEHVVGRIAGLLAEHGHLDSFTLERLGHVAASAFVTPRLGDVEREEASSALHEVLAELYIRGRLDAASRVVSRLEPDSWALRIASPYVKTAVALIRAGHTSDPDPLEDFVSSIQKLAAASGPRVDLLPVAERCIGLVPEIWEAVPQPLLESAALEVVRVMCASGESERTIDLDLVWADNGVPFSGDFRAQLEAVRSERIGTYDAFQGRLRTLRKQLAILEGQQCAHSDPSRHY